MSHVLKRPQAQRDLAELWSFIADDSEEQADRFLAGIEKSLQLWATQPLMGRKRDELAPDVRSMSHGRYVIFVLPRAEGIEVLRVLHAGRDISPDDFSSTERR